MGDDPIRMKFRQSMPRSEWLRGGSSSDHESYAREKLRHQIAAELMKLLADGRLYQVRMTEKVHPPETPIEGPSLNVTVEIVPMERMPPAPESPDWRPNGAIPEDFYAM